MLYTLLILIILLLALILASLHTDMTVGFRDVRKEITQLGLDRRELADDGIEIVERDPELQMLSSFFKIVLGLLILGSFIYVILPHFNFR